MAFIRVRNDWGDVLINDDYVNLRLANKGPLSLLDGDGFQYMDVSYVAANPSYPPIIAVRCTTHLSSVVGLTVNGNSYTFRIGFMVMEGTNPPHAASGEYFIFDAPAPTSQRIGNLCVRNATGMVVFDSGYEYMNVIGVYSFPPFTSGEQPITKINLDPARKYAACVMQLGFFWQYNSAEIDDGASEYWETDILYMYDGIMWDGGTLTHQGATYKSDYYQTSSSQGIGKSTAGSGIHMIIDVTGF
ncbi:hypothetical protein [Dickeya fangzhongdai]|uniref:hypothetical protein n=1 Tax=Dickeya fangzhongdai TaxID=1778540 RepID=UPI001ADBAC8D|nr:hypothetical protein [Dickeya fangzhongdai]MBO8132448.1 hypothetical protein [Dickeya fangzhongdai]